MKIVVGIDDTDSLESRGTGKLMEIMAGEIEARGWGRCANITRHQLFVDPAIPYTSHNSAMCFEAEIQQETMAALIDFGKQFLTEESAEGSDPGFCVAATDNGLPREHLIHFGLRAKHTVLTKEAAYNLAETAGVHLTEHGGTGQGVIGALAGIGLRLSGNDGRFRGWYHFGRAGSEITVKELCAQDPVDQIRTETGEVLSGDTIVQLGDDRIKTVFKDGKQMILTTGVAASDSACCWRTLTKKEAKRY